jgi:hypothetical protein
MENAQTIKYSISKLELDKNRLRVKNCPCGKSNRDGKFVPFIGYEDKGYCHSCGKTFLPDLPQLEQGNIPHPIIEKRPKDVIPKKRFALIPDEVLNGSLKKYESNNFVKFLINLFGEEITFELIAKYHIGTSKYRFEDMGYPNYRSQEGATVFWQRDFEGKIRSGKIMLYNEHTGKRIKEPYDHITWVHSALKMSAFNLKQCLFGEHLLQINLQPVAIVESEKTAIIASVYFPHLTWLATGGANGLTKDKCETLNKHGAHVILFPDISTSNNGKENVFDSWSRIAKEHLTSFVVSDLLQNSATEEKKKEGLDLADYLINFKPEQFRDEVNLSKLDSANEYPEDWDEPIKAKNNDRFIEQFIAINSHISSLISNLELVQVN